MRFALPAPTTGVVTAAALTTARPNGADPARAAGERGGKADQQIKLVCAPPPSGASLFAKPYSAGFIFPLAVHASQTTTWNTMKHLCCVNHQWTLSTCTRWTSDGSLTCREAYELYALSFMQVQIKNLDI